MKKLSVIIPCYNAEKFIIRCLKSIEKQNYKNIEVIIIDDCSKDNTLKKIDLHRGQFSFDLKIINNEKNLGPALSRNKGIQISDSKFITFCDADDWYEENYFNTMFSLIEEYKADIAFCNYNVVNEKSDIEPRKLGNKDGIIDIYTALSLDYDSLCMLFVKTDIMKKTLLPDLRNGEDMAVVPLLLVKSKTIVATSKCLYNYYRYSGSASQQSNINIVNSLILSYDHIKKYFPKDFKLELEFLGVKNVLYSSIITLFSYSYNKKKANEILYQFNNEFPRWYKNKYIKNLVKYKRIVLKLLQHKMYFIIKIVAIFRNFATSRNS